MKPARRPLIVEVIQSPRRWMTKHFPSQAAQNEWIKAHQHELQIVPLFVDNGYAVEFRKLLDQTPEPRTDYDRTN